MTAWFLRILFVTAALALATGVGVAAWFAVAVHGSQPVVQGRERVAGAAAPIEIVRDHWGIPHIFAASEADGSFGLGWAVAQDRLFQLALYRQLAQGRLAEVLGAWKPVLAVDRLFRTLDFHGQGRRMLERASPEVRAVFHAYYAGVNAYLRAHPERLPVELRLARWLGYRLEPFRDDDLLGMVGVMAFRLHPSWRKDVLFERLSAKLGRERALRLFPLARGGRPAHSEQATVQGTAAAEPLRALLLASGDEGLGLLPGAFWRVLDPWLVSGGSNAWAVGAARSTTGRALVANDPHLGLELPSLWYLAHLRAGDHEVAGATIPGLPFVAIGHNTRIAWGITAALADAGDFFVERLEPGAAGRVMFRGDWVPLATRPLAIRGWRGEETFQRRETPHGPIVTDLLPAEARAALPADIVLSYRWGFLVDERANELEGFYRLNRARTWWEFRAALRRFGGLALNVIYADDGGNVGLQVAGAIPRLPGEGLHFRRGWDGSEEWQGLVPFEALPSVFNPPQGWVGSANNPTFVEPAPFYVSGYFDAGERMRRIAEVLDSRPRHNGAQMRGLQADVRLPMARALVERVLAANHGAPLGPVARRALALLGTWRGDFGEAGSGATIFAYVYSALYEGVFGDELGAALLRAYRSEPADAVLQRILAGQERDWLDDATKGAQQSLDDVLRIAFRNAIGRLERERGGDPARWGWGQVHQLVARHPLGLVPGLGRGFNLGPLPAPGFALTVDRAGQHPGDLRVSFGASLRLVVDFSDLDYSGAILPGGQSGVPGSPHYGDQLPLYLEGRLVPLMRSRARIELGDAATLTLEPGGG
ncbi:MAG: penicillin acylase family protein [Candidatus Lambdaproteobacteria bacterium]|nr:penicillin acylase family protein [Candidatus Lambdaproteobacteria bacterium]